MAKAYIKLFFSVRTDFEALDDAEFRRLILGGLFYAETHIEPSFIGNEKILWPIFRNQIDRDLASYEQISRTNSNNAKKKYEKDTDLQSDNMRPHPTASDRIQSYPTDAKKKEERSKEKEVRSKKKDKDFILFWSAYPKKKSKGEAEKVWNRLNPPIDKVLDAIEKQKKSNDWMKDKGQYIPYPSKWLNGMCWEDEIEQNLTSKADYGSGASHF